MLHTAGAKCAGRDCGRAARAGGLTLLACVVLCGAREWKDWEVGQLRDLQAVYVRTSPGCIEAERLSPGLMSRIAYQITRSLSATRLGVTNDSLYPATLDVVIYCQPAAPAAVAYSMHVTLIQPARAPDSVAVEIGGGSGVSSAGSFARAVRQVIGDCTDELITHWLPLHPKPWHETYWPSEPVFIPNSRHSPSLDSAVRLIIAMGERRRQEELRRLFAPCGLVTYSEGVRDLFWWKWNGRVDTHPVFARDIRDFGWDRALERVPGVVVR